jgi:hypothetical protein
MNELACTCLGYMWLLLLTIFQQYLLWQVKTLAPIPVSRTELELGLVSRIRT